MIARTRAIDRTGSTGERDRLRCSRARRSANDQMYARNGPRSNRRSSILMKKIG